MARYIVKRLLALIPTILIIVFVIYFILDLTPGDPGSLILGQNATAEAIAAKNEELGYNDPLLVRYVRYIFDLCRGDFGECWSRTGTVFDAVISRFPVTATLALGSTVIGVTVGMLFGILSAVKQYSVLDVGATTFAMFLSSFPAFWIGMMLIIMFALKLGWLPSYGAETLRHFILPWITCACCFVASTLRMTRTSLLEAIRMDYVRTARAKGQKESIVIFKHALRNALLPVITMMGMDFGGMLGGTVTIETVFSLPGVGTLILEGIRMKDVPLVTGSLVILAICFTSVMLIIDILYAFIDPQIKARYLKR